MRNILCFLIIFTIAEIKCNDFTSLKPTSTPEVQTKAVEDLIRRLLPEKANLFKIKIQPNDSDAFHIEKHSIVEITATSGVTAALGLNHYLKYYCHCQISWQTSQLQLPETLPEINVTIPLNDKFRYYQNVCTTSYSFVWWDWQQWQKHIDWIVLNGFNLVLASTGQEAIWDKVYKNFKLTQNDIDEHFTGPAFLSWLRMGNIRGWGGPLSPAWHNRTIILQKQILKKMRDFGIITVLPAFAGHVPRAFKRLYPNAKMSEIEPWNDFNDTYCCSFFLEPTDDLFNQIGKAFLFELISEFGTDHIYNCDSFNENPPASGDLTYLSNVGQSIYKAMTDIDSDAIWLLQGWMFYYDDFWEDKDRVRSLLTVVPLGKMIILDLQSEQFPQYDRFEWYFGQPFIWCMLHDFGGTLGMFGSSTIINSRPIDARNANGSTMIGTGLTPEGINQNYVIYDLMGEMSWRQKPVNLSQWFDDYTIRRYGLANDDAKEAWRILQRTVYDYKFIIKIRGKYVITRSPNLKIDVWYWYSRDDLIQAWTKLLQASDDLKQNSGYQYDLVDVTRQFLQVNGDFLYQMLVQAFRDKNQVTFSTYSRYFLETFSDLEAILGTNENFLLGPWLESAKSLASDVEEAIQFEFNARNQISLWGPRGEIMDYANKQWAGVVGKLFTPRWSMFVNYLNDTLVSGRSFNQSFISEKIFNEVEEPFTLDRSLFPVEPVGDAVLVAREIHNKWVSGK